MKKKSRSELTITKLAIEEDEGPALAAYHANAREREKMGPGCHLCYMPYSKSEFLAIYDLYRKDQLSPQIIYRYCSDKAMEMIWDQIVSNILFELLYRTLDRKRDLLDKYLEKFSDFVSCIDECGDKVFISGLFCNVNGLAAILFGCISGVNDEVKEGKLPKTDLLYLVMRLDKIMESSNAFKGSELLSNYNDILADESFEQSAEYKAMEEIIEQMFSGGVPLTADIEKQ